MDMKVHEINDSNDFKHVTSNGTIKERSKTRID
jgi:hypothetical protein